MNYDMIKKASLVMLLAVSASATAGNFDERFPDLTGDKFSAEYWGSMLGGVEGVVGGVITLAGGTSMLSQAGVKGKLRALVKTEGAMIIGGALMLIDGGGRLYLYSKDKSPTLTPLPGFIAYALDGKGLMPDVKVAIRQTLETTRNKVKDTIDSVESPKEH